MEQHVDMLIREAVRGVTALGREVLSWTSVDVGTDRMAAAGIYDAAACGAMLEELLNSELCYYGSRSLN